MATPPRSSTVADAPRTQIGAQLPLSPWTQPHLDERETARDLRWPQNVKTYSSMLNDARMEASTAVRCS